MEWLSLPNDSFNSSNQVQPRCLINLSGCVVDMFGVCLIVIGLPDGKPDDKEA